MFLTVKKLDSQQEKEAIHILRAEVFINEQGVPPELEMDEFDSSAIHAVAYASGIIVATGRLIMDTPSEGRIGRMAVEASLRRIGVGTAVLAFLENEAKAKGVKHIILHAQDYVKNFYVKHGYVEQGETFLEAGILHIEMRKNIL